MKRFLLRTMLCFLLFLLLPVASVQATEGGDAGKRDVVSRQQEDSHIDFLFGFQYPSGYIACPSGNSLQTGSFRPMRFTPEECGKNGRDTAQHPYPNTFSCQLLDRIGSGGNSRSYLVFTSPRSYYVIALRRLLC